MHNIEIIEANLVLNFPENAQELNREQLIAFSRWLLLYQNGTINYDEFRVKLVYDFLNLKRTVDVNTDNGQLVTSNINLISQLVDSFFTDKRENAKVVKMLNMDFLHQKLPKIKTKNGWFYGPSDALFNTVYGEYLQLMTYFNAFSKDGDIKDLDAMIATIYRPKKRDFETQKLQPDFDGDIRQKFNSNLTESYVDELSNVSYEIKYAIYLYVASSQHFIANSNALDIGNGNTIDLTVLFKSSGTSSSNNSLGMVGTLYSLAETNVFGHAKDVATQNTYDILTYLAKQTIEFNKQKRHNNALT